MTILESWIILEFIVDTYMMFMQYVVVIIVYRILNKSTYVLPSEVQYVTVHFCVQIDVNGSI